MYSDKGFNFPFLKKQCVPYISFPFNIIELCGLFIGEGLRALLLLLSLSPLYRVFTRMSPRQTMSLGDTLLQLHFRFIVSTLYGAYLPRSYVGSDGLYVSTFRRTCAVPNIAVFCSSRTSWLPGMLSTYFLNDFEMVPVAPIITIIIIIIITIIVIITLFSLFWKENCV